MYLLDPTVVDEPDRDRRSGGATSPGRAAGGDEAAVLELLEVLHDADAGHLEATAQRAQRLAVFTEQLIEQAPPGRIGEGLEDGVHPGNDR